MILLLCISSLNICCLTVSKFFLVLKFINYVSSLVIANAKDNVLSKTLAYVIASSLAITRANFPVITLDNTLVIIILSNTLINI